MEGDRLVRFEYVSARIIKSEGRGRGASLTTIVVLDPHLEVLAVRKYTDRFFAVAIIGKGGGTPITFVSAYFKYSVGADFFTDRLGEILEGLDDRVVIETDMNAHSDLWYSRSGKVRFLDKLVQGIREVERRIEGDLEGATETLVDGIKVAMKDSMPKMGKVVRMKPPWWDEKLTSSKGRVRAIRRSRDWRRRIGTSTGGSETEICTLSGRSESPLGTSRLLSTGFKVLSTNGLGREAGTVCRHRS